MVTPITTQTKDMTFSKGLFRIIGTQFIFAACLISSSICFSQSTTTAVSECNNGSIFIELDPSLLSDFDPPYTGSHENLSNGDYDEFTFSSSSSHLIENLSFGEYEIIVWLSDDCYIIFNTSLAPLTNFTVVENITHDVSSDCSGSIVLDINGGTGNLTFEWSGPAGFIGSNSNAQNGLCPGTYSYIITDENSCMNQNQIVIGSDCEDTDLNISAIVSNAQKIPGVDCNNGSIELNANGIGPFRYYWNVQGYCYDYEECQSIDGLATGVYCVTIEDVGCDRFKEACYTIECCTDHLYEDFEVDAVIMDAPDCKNGSIKLPEFGPEGRLTYYEDRSGEVVPNRLYNLDGGGEYCFRIYTSNCTYTKKCFTVECCRSPDIQAFCEGNRMFISVTVPHNDYEILIYAGSGFGPLERTGVINETTYVYETQEANTHTIRVINNRGHGCEYIEEVNTGGVPGGVTFDVTPTSNCATQEALREGARLSCDGEILINVSDPEIIGSLTFYGPEGRVDAHRIDETEFLIRDICESGIYKVCFQGDDSGCEQCTSIEVCCCNEYREFRHDYEGYPFYRKYAGDCYEDGSRLDHIDEDITNIYMTGANDGAINITVVGGLPHLTYSWTGPLGYASSSEDIADLAPGTYCVTVTENGDCSQDELSECFEIVDCSMAGIEITGDISNTCPGFSVGSISVVVNGDGTPPYS